MTKKVQEINKPLDDNDSENQLKPPKAPLTIDEIVQRDNVPAALSLPAATRKRLSTRIVYFSGAETSWKKQQKIVKSSPTHEGTFSLALPPSVFLGIPGDEGKRVAPKSLSMSLKGKAECKLFKPDWSPLIYHPKLGAKSSRRPLRRFDGRRVVPVNQEFIYGTDDRQVFYPSGYPWQCIGKVDVFPDANSEYPTSSGSGVLIGDRLVLTAGHVPPQNPKSGQWKMRFTAGLYNGNPVNGPGAISYVSDFSGFTGGVSGEDYAILRLYDTLGMDLGYFGWKSYDGGWDGGAYWWLAGYPYDIAGSQSPSYQSGIVVLDQDSDIQGGMEIEHHGDIASGDSGGPFWGFWDDGPYVVGTCSGHEHVDGPSWTGGEDNNIAAGGNLLGNLIQAARNNWPA